jgi:hypothetical protein
MVLFVDYYPPMAEMEFALSFDRLVFFSPYRLSSISVRNFLHKSLETDAGFVARAG